MSVYLYTFWQTVVQHADYSQDLYKIYTLKMCNGYVDMKLKCSTFCLRFCWLVPKFSDRQPNYRSGNLNEVPGLTFYKSTYCRSLETWHLVCFMGWGYGISINTPQYLAAFVCSVQKWNNNRASLNIVVRVRWMYVSCRKYAWHLVRAT